MDALSRLDIDLAAIGRNLARLQDEIGPSCQLCPVVKSDAYGLGARRIAPALEAAGASMLAVYSPQEAAELLAPTCSVPLLVFMPVRQLHSIDALYSGLRSGQVHLVVHDQSHLDDLTRLAEELDELLHLHLKVDTGMHRGGCVAERTPQMLDHILDNRRLHLAGICTHFGSSAKCDQSTKRQRATFDAVLDACIDRIDSDCLVHCANTAAVFRGPALHRSMVRVGLGWAGACPPGPVRDHSRSAQSLESVARWTSRVVQMRHVEAGDPVGYDGRWVAPRDSIIGVVPVGYTDGYPQVSEHDQAFVGVLRGDRRIGWAPVVGAVCMDQLIVDLTELVDTVASGHGYGIELLSREPDTPNSLLALTESTGLKPHALLSCLHARVERRYHGEIALIESEDIDHRGLAI
ncbi:MAG: alanine racemase [Phycisphaerales bacterium]|nr:alanine racemase [Phycisphaerales bacterium]